MRVKRTTYAKDKVLDEYAEMIQSLKREHQTVHTEKNKLKDFLRTQEEDRKRKEQELLREQHDKQMDIYNIYSRMTAAHTQKKQNIKRRSYYESDSSNYAAESIEDNHRGYEKRKKRPTKKLT